MSNRTDTVLLPRIVATASAPLTPARGRRWRAAVLLLAFVAGIVLAAVAGLEFAEWLNTPVELPTVTRVEPVVPLGTDAGLITEPAR